VDDDCHLEGEIDETISAGGRSHSQNVSTIPLDSRLDTILICCCGLDG